MIAYRRQGKGPLLVCHPGGPGFSSLYPGNGISWTYVLGNLTGHAACGKIVVTTPYGQPVTTVDLGCTATI